MLQNPCKTLGFKKNMVYKIPPGGGEVNHIQPVAYMGYYCQYLKGYGKLGSILGICQILTQKKNRYKSKNDHIM